MDKTKKDVLIIALSMVAENVNKLYKEPGVCGFGPYLNRVTGDYEPGVHLQFEKFMELFGDDTEYEYKDRGNDDREVRAVVNGVIFYALVTDLDRIGKDGGLKSI